MSEPGCPFCDKLAHLEALGSTSPERERRAGDTARRSCSGLVGLVDPAAPKSLDEGEVVWPFSHSVALLGEWQAYPGYCVLVSRRHARELFELPDDERRGYLDELCLLARAIDQAFQPHKLNYELLGNQVPHLHWHVFPRSLDDPDRLAPVWRTLDGADHDAGRKQTLRRGPEPREATTEKLRQALVNLGAPRP